MMKHMMLDLETLGLEPGCGIIQVGLAAFNTVNPQLITYSKRWDISTEENLMLGFTSNPATMRWWKEEQEGIPQGRFYERRYRNMAYTLAEVGSVLDDYWYNHGFHSIWAKPATFDFPILNAAYDKLGVERPRILRSENFRYWNCWQTLKNTILAATPDLNKLPPFNDKVEHDAQMDAILQAKQCSIILGALNASVVFPIQRPENVQTGASAVVPDTPVPQKPAKPAKRGKKNVVRRSKASKSKRR